MQLAMAVESCLRSLHVELKMLMLIVLAELGSGDRRKIVVEKQARERERNGRGLVPGSGSSGG